MNQHLRPVAPVAPEFDYALDPKWAYLEWLYMEARLLQMEIAPNLDIDISFSPVNTFAHNFHFPDGDWQSMPKPSTRALQVMQAAGVCIPEGVA